MSDNTRKGWAPTPAPKGMAPKASFENNQYFVTEVCNGFIVRKMSDNARFSECTVSNQDTAVFVTAKDVGDFIKANANKS